WTTRPQPVGDTQWRFPPADAFLDGDLVAVGGDLGTATLIHAYRRSMFPMKVTALREILAWWSPDPRGILPLDRLRVTRSMRQSAKRFEIRVDTCFAGVIRRCGDESRAD